MAHGEYVGSSRRRALRTLAALVLVMAATGCNQQKRDESPPGAAIPCYIDHDMLPGRVQSTSIIPLANDTTYPSVSDGMTTSLYAALLGRQLFNVTVVPPADASTEVGGADPHRSLTLKDLARMRQALGSDVVLIGTVGHFQPYPRMQIGVSLRMVDLRDGRVIWAINHVWDSTDKATQQRIEKYFQRMRGKDYDPIEWRLATVSPATFQEFVAWEMATTLPGPATGDDVVRTPPATGHARL